MGHTADTQTIKRIRRMELLMFGLAEEEKPKKKKKLLMFEKLTFLLYFSGVFDQDIKLHLSDNESKSRH